MFLNEILYNIVIRKLYASKVVTDHTHTEARITESLEQDERWQIGEQRVGDFILTNPPFTIMILLVVWRGRP